MTGLIVQGHFDLKLNVQSCTDRSHLMFRIKILRFYKNQYIKRHGKQKTGSEVSPQQLANGNLLGVLHFYNKSYSEAYECLLDVLEQDPKNLNALENLYQVCQRTMNSQEAEKYKGKRLEVINNPDPMTNARFEAEHAYALAFETYSATHERRRYVISNDIYEKCLEETKGMNSASDKIEKAEWKMCMVWNYKKIYNRNFLQDFPKDKNEARYPVILQTLYDIRELVPEHAELNSLVWAYFGYYFWKKPYVYNHVEGRPDKTNIDIPKVVMDNNMAEYFNDPEKCFKTAMGVLDEPPIEVLQLYTGWLIENKQFDHGIENMTLCIKTDSSEGNYFSFSKRGELLYGRCMSLTNTGGCVLKDFQDDLNQAISDFKIASIANPSSFLFGYLGSCYCLLYEYQPNKMNKIRCLDAFQKGLDCLDGTNNPNFCYRHATCLKKLGEEEWSFMIFKRCVEIQNPKSGFTGDVKELLKVLIEKFDIQDVQKDIIDEAAFWFNIAFSKYDRKSFQKMIHNLVESHNDKILFFTGIFGNLYSKHNIELQEFILDISDCYKDKDSGRNDIVNLRDVVIFQRNNLAISTNTANKGNCDMQPRNRKGFAYDFFVIHSEPDEKWVMSTLLIELENYCNFKGYISNRDSVPGMTIIKNIEKAIDECYKFIVVITPEFHKSQWCSYQSQQALTDELNKTSQGNIIPIVMEEAKMPKFLRLIHHVNLEKECINKGDWQRLADALDK